MNSDGIISKPHRFIKSSAAAEINTHNYLISDIFVGSDWTSSCDALLESKLEKLYSCVNLMAWNETCYETLQNWSLLNDRSCSSAGRRSSGAQQQLRESFSGSWPAGPSCSELKAGTGCTSTVILREDHLWCRDGGSPAFRPGLMFSFRSKRIRVQGFFTLYHYILYIFIFFISHKRCFVPGGTHSVFDGARQRGHLVSGLEDWEDLSVLLVSEPCLLDYEII